MSTPADYITRLTHCVAAELAAYPVTSFCLAFSGGRDSTVLLHVLAKLDSARVRAVYVNHGLHPDAERWGALAAAQCAAWDVPFSQLQIRVDEGTGLSLEAAARDARYGALRAQLRPQEILLTAHHQRDQLETVLLALLRGGGVAGLAGMPSYGEHHGMPLLRPLLSCPEDDIHGYAAQVDLRWSEDPSNASPNFDRNYLRMQILPALLARWPQAGATVARSARLSAGAADLLSDLGCLDLAGQLEGNRLPMMILRKLAGPRQRNALRWVIQSLDLPMPGERQLDAALETLLTSRVDATPLAAWPGARVRRYQDELWFFSEATDPGSFATEVTELKWDTSVPLELPAGLGRLAIEPVQGTGLRPEALSGGVRVVFRQGGERLRVEPGGAHRPLKKLLQETHVLPWMRPRVPLLYAGTELIAVGDLWHNADFAAAAGAPAAAVRWTDHPALRRPEDCG